MEECRAKRGVAATSRRHQVTTSSQQCRSQQFSNVATSPRHDVSSKICTSSFNVRTARKLGHREAYDQRHEIPEQSNTVFEELPGICTAFHFLDIFGYYNDVFDTRRFVLFFHDVLDLFLGLHQTLS